MSGKIFINYRRGDEPGFTGRLFDRLETAFPADQLFMDVDSIAPGLDFVRVLEEHVGRCDIFLAVIGPNWLAARDEAGNKRLDNPNDFVRIEIESALKLGKRIVPVLVNNAAMPLAHQLPESLEPLSRRNAVRLSHERFRADTQGLVSQLEKAVEDARAALQRADDEAARDAELVDTVEAYQAFLKERPQSRHAARARNRLRALRAKTNPLTGSSTVWMAGAYALFVLVILFAANFLMLNGVFTRLGLKTEYISLIVLVFGLLMALRYRGGPGIETSLYWLGCVGWVLILLSLSVLDLWGFPRQTKFGFWNVVIALPVAGSAIAVAKWRRKVVSKLEIAIYWLGSALALLYIVRLYGKIELPVNTSGLANVGAALIAIVPVFFLLKPRTAPNWGEFGVYGAGLTVLLGHALSDLALVEGITAFLCGMLGAAGLIALLSTHWFASVNADN